MLRKTSLTLFFLILFLPIVTAGIQVGADRWSEIKKHTDGKRVGLTLNHTSILTDSAHTHLLDHLLAKGVDVKKLYTPEHGFRGTADAGAIVRSGKDTKSGLPVISLYGNHKKPKVSDLRGIDVMLFDLQDVGVRFYTYISTMYYVMEACAEVGIPVVILDRPNPHDTIDGAVLKDTKYRSFVSLLPIPAVHGLTLGEAALMINGEGWLKGGIRADLSVITVTGWEHGDPYSLPIPPSPNLRSDRAIALYPTICYFEAASWSEGRGTDHPFEQVGYPDKRMGKKQFVPRSGPGATAPKHEGKACYGPDLSEYDVKPGINLDIILDAAQVSRKYGVRFINRTALFHLLAGNGELLEQIDSGMTADEIRATWSADLDTYKALRHRYLLYPDHRD